MKLDDAQVEKVGDWLARREIMNCSPCKRDELIVVGTTEITVDLAAAPATATPADDAARTAEGPNKLTLVVLRCHRCGNVTTFDAAHIDLES